VLQCVVMFCSVLQRVAVCHSVLQRVAMCYSLNFTTPGDRNGSGGLTMGWLRSVGSIKL